jgi:hypothetical protein
MGRFHTAIAFAMCASIVACNDDGPRWACLPDVVPREAVVNITSVADIASNVRLDEFTVSDFTFDGTEFSAELAIQRIVEPHAVVVDGLLECKSYCGFGTSPGQWGFTVSANGYKPKSYVVDANWGNHETDGCEVWGIFGTQLAVTLESE